jgi:L-fuconolactonase
MIMARIDAHQHYWDISRGDYGWLTPALSKIYRDFGPHDLSLLLKETKVARTILVQAAPTEEETEYLLRLAKIHHSIAGVVGWVNFDQPDVAMRIAALAADPLLVGLRPMIQDIMDTDWMLSPLLAPALREMERFHLAFDALVKPRHLKALAQFARSYPGLSIVIDHGGKPDIAGRAFERWAADMIILAALPNISVKLSGLVTEAGEHWREDDLSPYIQHLLTAFEPRRILFGSDWPVLNLAGDYGSWIAIAERAISHLSHQDKAAVMGLNAARIYLSKRGRQ